jgi:hypothetical protein
VQENKTNRVCLILLSFVLHSLDQKEEWKRRLGRYEELEKLAIMSIQQHTHLV